MHSGGSSLLPELSGLLLRDLASRPRWDDEESMTILPPAFDRTECMDAKKAEWTAIQLDIAQAAIFQDHDLSFKVLDGGRLAVPDGRDWLKVHQTGTTIEGLHTVGGLDISFYKDVEDQAVATLTVLSFPDLQVSGLRVDPQVAKQEA